MFVDGVQAYQSKISAIVEWPTSKNIHNVRSFYGLASFYIYKKIIRNFNSLIAPIIECLNGCAFQWPDKAKTNFQLVK
jgi:hypothetical protein